MKRLVSFFLCVFLTALLSLGSVYCSQVQQIAGVSPGRGEPSADVTALVNGDPITKADLELEMRSQQARIDIWKILAANDPESILSVDEMLQKMGLGWSEMAPEEKRFFLRLKRESEITASKNEAFNRLAREAVLYQEAVKRGFQITRGEAREYFRELEELSRLSFERAGKDEKEYQIQTGNARKLDRILQEKMGFATPQDLEEYRIRRATRTVPIGRLKEKLQREWGIKHPDIRGQDFYYAVENYWEDYTESLLRSAEIAIKDPELKLSYSTPGNNSFGGN